jgi:hypothetical protein
VQSGQRRQRHCRTAFADTHASSTASRNSLHRSHGLAKALRSGISPRGVSFWTGHNNEKIGDIQELIVNKSGKMGEHYVAVPMEQLR